MKYKEWCQDKASKVFREYYDSFKEYAEILEVDFKNLTMSVYFPNCTCLNFETVLTDGIYEVQEKSCKIYEMWN